MKQLLEELRLYWWKRAYKKIWNVSPYKENLTFSTKTEDDSNRLAAFIYKNIQPGKNKVVLDVGCGNGNLGRRVFGDCDLVVQTDYSFNALRLIKKGETSPNISVLQSEVNNLPFKEDTFDYIFLYSIIHYSGSLENANKWIMSMFRLLNNDGKLYIGDVPILKKLYRELRYRINKIRTLNHIKYFFAEFMQVSFSVDNFLDIGGIAQLKIIPQPEYLKFSKWRVDIIIQKL